MQEWQSWLAEFQYIKQYMHIQTRCIWVYGCLMSISLFVCFCPWNSSSVLICHSSLHLTPYLTFIQPFLHPLSCACIILSLLQEWRSELYSVTESYALSCYGSVFHVIHSLWISNSLHESVPSQHKFFSGQLQFAVKIKTDFLVIKLFWEEVSLSHITLQKA